MEVIIEYGMGFMESPAIMLPVVFILGIITSLSPCILSLMPILLGYIGGYAQSRRKSFFLSVYFVFGLGITFAILGLIAAYMGTFFGQIGTFWFIIMAFVAIIMGLNLLGILKLNFPGIKRIPFKANNPLGAVLLGLSFGLVASPCSTPVLAGILSFVAAQQQTVYGGSLLFFYGLGHGTPLIILGTFTSLLKGLPTLQGHSKYFSYVSGIVLLLLGFYLLYMYY